MEDYHAVLRLPYSASFPCVPGASVLTALMLKRDLFDLIFRKERDTQGLT